MERFVVKQNTTRCLHEWWGVIDTVTMVKISHHPTQKIAEKVCYKLNHDNQRDKK